MGSIAIGDRIGVGDDRGTVRYVGEVDGYNGEWIGVEWDDPKRGKHNGTVKGRKYFEARENTSGSFVRAVNVDRGRSITDEMQCRYTEDSEMDTHQIGVKTIEMVAMEKTRRKQKNLWKLGCVVLDRMHVAKPPADGCAPFKLCTELNLYNNLLAYWSDLLSILDYFPSLRYLNIKYRHNPYLETVSSDEWFLGFELAFSLKISDRNRSFRLKASRVMQIFPGLNELYMSNNGLERFDPAEHGSHLTVLDLEGNPIVDFSHLHNLSTLPRLKSLNLTDCALTSVRLPEPIGFAQLETLNLRDNDINDWESISELARLPSLERLFCKGSAMVPKSEFGLDIREIVIAKLPNLIDLERTDISAVERRSAEIRFLNNYSRPPISQHHIRDIERLTKIHGEPDVVALSKKTLGLSLLKLNLRMNDKTIECSLPDSTSIQRMKGIVSRMFKLNPGKVFASFFHLICLRAKII
ncbi:unnamed protein product [Anisakis simplex]|uniref:Tubulin-specific chaperone E n=1 Tax=Anisakis simplex TaxID=6269 RepID=A0A158PP59_ANISI|nr:unnamed protein product [Anisakis simplex]